MYPNPLSDLPKVNGDSVKVPNQGNDEEITFLFSQPVMGTGEKTRKLRVIRLSIQLVGGFLLAMVLLKAVQQADATVAEHKEQRIKKAKDELFQEKMEQRRREKLERRF